MTHYTCTGGCSTESGTPGTCHDDDCLKQGQPLTPCGCTNGEHGADDDDDYYSRF